MDHDAMTVAGRKNLIVTVVVFCLCVAGKSAAAGGGDFAQVVEEASRILVLDNERIKPLDTYARHAFVRFSGRSSYKGTPAIAWLCKMIFDPRSVSDDAVFLINNPEVADAIGIVPQKKRRYTFNQLSPGLEKLEKEGNKIMSAGAASRSPVERELLRTLLNVRTFIELGSTLSFVIPSGDFAIADSSFASYLSLRMPVRELSYYQVLGKSKLLSSAARAAMKKDRSSWTQFDEASAALAAALYRWANSEWGGIRIVPVAGNSGIQWASAWEVVQHSGSGVFGDKAITSLVKAWHGYDRGEYADCASGLHAFCQEVDTKGIRVHASLERAYNAVDPFARATSAYFAALVVLIIGLLRSVRAGRIGCGVIIGIGFLLQTFGLFARIIIMHRPPVTTMYETFVFVAWVSVALGLAIEAFRKNGLGLFVAGFTGALFSYFAGKFGSDGDTMGMLAPVLNSNFWLTTHIMTISMGYAGCVAAGALAHVYLIQRAVFKRTCEATAQLAASIYASIAFGLTFTTIGTVLGGLWADQAWGRFWGWDPKENGALLIIIWCAVVLHARSGKMIKDIGTAYGAIVAFVLVMLAWVGVNLLGVGLHAYGFTTFGARILLYVGAIEILFIAAILVARARGPMKFISGDDTAKIPPHPEK
jgi:cytochrome c-type biogenesis protein CcsB